MLLELASYDNCWVIVEAMLWLNDEARRNLGVGYTNERMGWTLNHNLG